MEVPTATRPISRSPTPFTLAASLSTARSSDRALTPLSQASTLVPSSPSTTRGGDNDPIVVHGSDSESDSSRPNGRSNSVHGSQDFPRQRPRPRSRSVLRRFAQSTSNYRPPEDDIVEETPQPTRESHRLPRLLPMRSMVVLLTVRDPETRPSTCTSAASTTLGVPSAPVSSEEGQQETAKRKGKSKKSKKSRKSCQYLFRATNRTSLDRS